MGNKWLNKKKETVSTWDFQTALGDVIKKKYESQYVKVVEVTHLSVGADRKTFYPYGEPITHKSLTKEFVAKASHMEMRTALNSLALKISANFKETSIFHRPDFSNTELNEIVDRAMAKLPKFDPEKGHPFNFFATVMDGLIRTRLVQKKREYPKEPRKTLPENWGDSFTKARQIDPHIRINPNDLA